MRRVSVAHEFVDLMPPELQEGVLYVSIPYATAVHLCACGCGNKVVTPISPAEWKLLWDGETVSLTPSIGNWEFPCRSHYWIRRNQIKWARQWSDEEIAEGRRLDADDMANYFDSRSVKPAISTAPVLRPRQSLIMGLLRLLGLGK